MSREGLKLTKGQFIEKVENSTSVFTLCSIEGSQGGLAARPIVVWAFLLKTKCAGLLAIAKAAAGAQSLDLV